MIKFIKALIAPSFFVCVLACSIFESPEMIHFTADITGVDQLSDSSIQVSIDVYDRGNAWVCYLYVYYDTVPVKLNSRRALVEQASDCQLQDHYDFVLGGLKKDTKYFLRLGGWGEHDIGGPNESKFGFMENTVDFTLH